MSAEAAKTSGAVTIPVEVSATKSTDSAPTVSVSIPSGDSAQVAVMMARYCDQIA